MEGRGHVCLPLRELVLQPQSVLAWPDKMQTGLSTLWAELPKGLSAWLKALQRSPVVRCAWRGVGADSADRGDSAQSADKGQPLVLGGTPEQPLLYLRRYWVYEQQVAQAMAERARALPHVDTEAARFWLDRLFPVPTHSGPAATTPLGAANLMGAQFTDAHDTRAPGPAWQKIACALALRSGLTVITGGPGTGKTYTAARLLALLLATSANPAQLRVALAAPTGKAAARLRQSIDQSLVSLQRSLGESIDLKNLTDRMGKASTVHALLGMQAGSRQFKHNAHRPLDVDVLVVGAGISGLSAAWHLKTHLPDKAFVVLEREPSFGGTWLTHTFPGIRSDSDLYTFGFGFKPWVGPPIATAAEIQAYLGDMIAENDLNQHIRYNHSIETAQWDSAAARWTLSARLPDGSHRRYRANFLWMAQGYYRHRQGHWPEIAGMADFKGPILHTEEWDETTDYAGKRVVVIGSGATAATVVPAMAQQAAGSGVATPAAPRLVVPGH
jgi:hypothetical protein